MIVEVTSMKQVISATVQIGSALLVRSAQTGELLRIKLVKAKFHDPREYNRNTKERVATSGVEENGFLKVSDASPLGRALLGKERGEIATVEAPAGIFTWEIVEILE